MPLRRKPKQLDAEPSLFEPAAGGRGGLVRTGRSDREGRGSGLPGIAAPGTTDEVGVLVAPPDGGGEDPAVRARARQIASRLALPRPRRDPAGRRGTGDLASLPYRGGSDDVDLDGTIEVLTERPVPEEEDIVVRERIRTRRSAVLAVDVSGSMRGSGSGPRPRRSGRSPPSCPGTTWRCSPSGRTQRCCFGSGHPCGRSSCSTRCSRSLRVG